MAILFVYGTVSLCNNVTILINVAIDVAYVLYEDCHCLCVVVVLIALLPA